MLSEELQISLQEIHEKHSTFTITHYTLRSITHYALIKKKINVTKPINGRRLTSKGPGQGRKEKERIKRKVRGQMNDSESFIEATGRKEWRRSRDRQRNGDVMKLLKANIVCICSANAPARSTNTVNNDNNNSMMMMLMMITIVIYIIIIIIITILIYYYYNIYYYNNCCCKLAFHFFLQFWFIVNFLSKFQDTIQDWIGAPWPPKQ